MPLITENGIAWTGRQYASFRMVFGAYLSLHFAALVPWGTELFSSRGVLPDSQASPLAHAFPNLLIWLDASPVVLAVLLVACGASVCLALGWRDKIAALVAWYVLACLLGRNPLILNPAMPYVGWLLIAHLFVPTLPPAGVEARGSGGRASWAMPGTVFAAGWILLAAGYSYSGYTKLISPSWIDGSALAKVLANPLARPTPIREALLALPAPVLQGVTWATLGLELAFAPLAVFRRIRPWLWAAAVGMHVAVLVLLDLADLTLGMLCIHAFTFNPAWCWSRATSAENPAVRDGPPGPRRRSSA